ncbi:MAG: hypothetical protein KC591_05245 [Gemmatimonadetes bacterium]|nr:hypothetical protein [Gemmatimonadota bacterium]
MKAARLDAGGRPEEIVAEDAPPPAGADLVREVDPEAYAGAVERALDRAGAAAPGADVRLGLASQRSSFLVWERATARPKTSIVSWQDRRAAAWCDARPELAARLPTLTGLPLSPHYFAPKLACVREERPDLRDGLDRGDLVAGTLDAWLLARWSGGGAGRTDVTMAARTLLVALGGADWDDGLLAEFGLSREALPSVGPSTGIAPETSAGRFGVLGAALSDQASGLLAALGDGDGAVINLGTGCFVLVPSGTTPRTVPGYLAGPWLAPAGGPIRYAIEGTVNAGGAVADRFGPPPTAVPDVDPAPDSFCLPDAAGVGAPYWRPTVPLTFSAAALAAEDATRRRAVLEGLAFRVRGILADLGPVPGDVRVSGGLANDPFVPASLAAVLGRSVTVVDEPEATLLGVAGLLSGRSSVPSGTTVEAHALPWLRAKYERWNEWLSRVLGEPAGPPGGRARGGD